MGAHKGTACYKKQPNTFFLYFNEKKGTCKDGRVRALFLFFSICPRVAVGAVAMVPASVRIGDLKRDRAGIGARLATQARKRDARTKLPAPRLAVALAFSLLVFPTGLHIRGRSSDPHWALRVQTQEQVAPKAQVALGEENKKKEKTNSRDTMRRLVESRLFMPPAASSYGAGDVHVGGMRVSSITVEGVRGGVPCATTFDPATGPDAPSDGAERGLIVYFHGNAEDMGTTAPRLGRLAAALGMDAMAVEYPGYGPPTVGGDDDDGMMTSSIARRQAPSEQTVHAAARAAVTYALDQRWIKRTGDIVLWGTSLGGAVAARLAADMSRARRPPGALVVASTFVTARDAARDLIGGPWWRLVGRGVFATIDHMPDVACPALFLHGDGDDVIPARHAGLLASACAPGVWWRVSIAPGGSHNDLDDDGFVVPQVRAFLDDTAFAHRAH